MTGKKAEASMASSDSESETEADTNKASLKPGGRKMDSNSAAAKSKIFRPRPQLPLIENRKCPVAGCDSSGHLSGKLDRHFTCEACPVYHNTTANACREAVSAYNKKDAARNKALLQLSSKSPLTSPTNEHRRLKIEIFC